jgi:hypothetical protein
MVIKTGFDLPVPVIPPTLQELEEFIMENTLNLRFNLFYNRTSDGKRYVLNREQIY